MTTPRSAIIITKITCIRISNDKLIFTTTNPMAVYPFKGYATVSMDCAYGKGASYCETHFPGVPFELIITEQ